MRKINSFLLCTLTISVLLTSCGKQVDESAVLVEYLESADSPINAESIPSYIVASDLQTLLATDAAYVIDIRESADYDAGHISGSVNVPASDVISHLDGMDVTGYDKVVIACYTGQTAAFTSSLVRMAGYESTSLKWGMAAWNQTCAGKLDNNSKNTYASQFEEVDNPKGEAGSMPVIETGMEIGEDILEARISEVLSAGFGEAAVSAEAVFGAMDNYYIVNYWKPEHYALGHVPGAIQYTPNVDLLSTEALNTLPTDKTIVVYCYTGQTSAYMAAYLKVLGYDAKSLKFGVNGMAHDWATTNELTHWDSKYVAGYDLVTE